MPVAATAPGVFTANVPTQSVGIVTNADGTQNTVTNPAAPNTTLTVYYTGEGQTSPATATNTLNPAAQPFPVPLALLTATIGGVDAPVTSYGPAPGLISGLSIATITVPALTGGGPQALVLTSGTMTSQGVTMVYVTN
jgi:uncharacterized protein (TIGR03437 family)